MQPDILQYTCYRSFLRDYADFKKRSDSSWTFNQWAKNLGLENNTSILKVINGERDAGPHIRKQLSSYFQFNQLQASHFEDLVQLAKAKTDHKTRTEILEQIKERNPQLQHQLLEDKTFGMISHWWYWAIRQLVRLHSTQAIAKKANKLLLFDLDKRNFTAAIKKLKQLQLLGIGESKHQPVATTQDVPSLAIQNLHREILSLAQEGLTKIEPSEREYTSLFLVYKSQDIEKVKAKIREFRNEFYAEFDSSKGDSGGVLQITFFPFTKDS